MTSPQQEIPLPVRIRHMREFIIAIAYYIAMTMTPVLRAKPGFNVLQPGAAFVMTAVMMLFNALMNFHVALPMVGRFGARESSDALWYYALLFLGFALWNRRARWKELLRGERWHTYSPGEARLASLLPVRPDLVCRVGEPIAVYLTGAVLRKLDMVGLGLWFEIASVAVYLVENYAHERALERDLAILDSLLESEVAAATADHFAAEGEGQPRSRSIRDTGGINTGVDPSLEAVIARRKKEAAGGAA